MKRQPHFCLCPCHEEIEGRSDKKYVNHAHKQRHLRLLAKREQSELAAVSAELSEASGITSAQNETTTRSGMRRLRAPEQLQGLDAAVVVRWGLIELVKQRRLGELSEIHKDMLKAVDPAYRPPHPNGTHGWPWERK